MMAVNHVVVVLAQFVSPTNAQMRALSSKYEKYFGESARPLGVMYRVHRIQMGSEIKCTVSKIHTDFQLDYIWPHSKIMTA